MHADSWFLKGHAILLYKNLNETTVKKKKTKAKKLSSFGALRQHNSRATVLKVY